MASTRKTEFPDKVLILAEFAKAIAHPARVAILKALAEKEMCICGELVADLPLAQATVSQHLKALKEAGLIKGEIDGPRSCYCIDWDAFASLQKYFGQFFTTMDRYREAMEKKPKGKKTCG